MQELALNKVFEGLKINATCVSAYSHRHFSFYDVELGPGCMVSKLRHFSNEIALGLKSRSIPIVKTITEKGIVRLQVVNSVPETLPFEKMYSSAIKPEGMLPFLFGETNEGTHLWVDMAKNPHMLVAGTTGSGKSVFLHTLIANALRDECCYLHLVDPKGVEFMAYKDVAETFDITYDDTVNMLTNLAKEMEWRYTYLAKLGISSVEGYHGGIFGYKLVIIDEVADLMLADKNKQFEIQLIKLAQKCRAVGIYLVLATQRPSVDVLTGTIKANFPARMSCKVSSRVDSNVILDMPGAEHLVGRGDAILKNNEYDCIRYQIAKANPADSVTAYKTL